MKHCYLLILIALSSCLVGCATIDGPEFHEVKKLQSENYATLLIFRTNALKGAAWPHSYYIDGVKVAELNAGGFTQLLVEGGERIVSTGPEKDKFFRKTTIKFHAGQSYYVQESSGDSVVDPTSFALLRDHVNMDFDRYRYQSPIAEKYQAEQ